MKIEINTKESDLKMNQMLPKTVHNGGAKNPRCMPKNRHKGVWKVIVKVVLYAAMYGC